MKKILSKWKGNRMLFSVLRNEINESIEKTVG